MQCGVLVVSRLCLGGILMYLGGVPVVSGWCLCCVLVIFSVVSWWYLAGILVVSWWYLGGVPVVSWLCLGCVSVLS